MRVPAKELKVKIKKAVLNQRLTNNAWRAKTHSSTNSLSFQGADFD
jgi:hypothetical protein